MTDMRRRLISREAQKCLKNLGLGAIPVDLEVLADKLDIILSAADRDSDGWSGMLMRQGDVFGIIYATNIDNRGFQRFSIAHELGHYCLPGHPEKVVPVDGVPHYSRADRGSKLDFEREADVFAASLLNHARVGVSIRR